MRVALLGMGPSATGYFRHCAVRGGRHAAFDQTWTVNAFGDIFSADLIFHMDDVRIQERRAEAGNKQIASLLEWMRKHPGPIYTSRAHPDYPGLVDFPLAVVLEATGGPVYFDSTPAYAVAYAVAIGVEELAPFGLDYAYDPKYRGEQGRACVEYWVGRGVCGKGDQKKGMHLYLPKDTFLLNTNGEKLYGYDTVSVLIEDDNGKPRVTLTEQNDGETCVHAVERYIHRGYEFIDAIRLAYGDLEGDYAFVIGRANDDKLFAFKKGSGMVVGIGEGFTLFRLTCLRSCH